MHECYPSGELLLLLSELRTQLTEVTNKVDLLEEAERKRQETAVDLQAEVLVATQKRVEAEAAAVEVEAGAGRRRSAIVTFTHLSDAAVTSWDPTTSTLTYNPASNTNNYAIGSEPLSATEPTSWTVHVEALGTGGSTWLFVGVIGETNGFDGYSHSHTTSYGWSGQQNNNIGYIAGQYTKDYGGWDAGLYVGDEATLTYNPTAHRLTMYLNRTDKTYSIQVSHLPRAYIHFNLARRNTKLRISLP